MRILIIEDEEKLAKGLKKGLEREGYAVDYLTEGRAGERRILLHQDDYDLLILDIMLPEKDGFAICKSARYEGVSTPILILTARDATEDKVEMLDAGADDYLVKPFSFGELNARVRALLRRPKQTTHEKLRAGPISLNITTRKAYYREQEVPLTLKEFGILEYLMRNENRVLSREQLQSHIWDFADDSMSNTIDVHIKNIRKKIDRDKDLLQTVRGIGYRIVNTTT